MRPDRPEHLCAVGRGEVIEIAPGVRFECLVGRHNGARHLTTGIVTFGPGAVLPSHTHPFSESVTLLEGALSAEVEGRRYRLARLDNIVIPPGRAHLVTNPSPSAPATVHVAMASGTPTRSLVAESFAMSIMPDDSCGLERAERVTRFATANRGSAGPNTVFIDGFNSDLMPGIEMSGGYGLFQPGGRLPAHVHDFDESICIVSGTATCVVEGRRYSMSDRATALQPRGRVHYFVNESERPMEMLWVYAGPVPERIIVAEACATPEGDPWR
jgi:quercetin dioxygenase-like cupin family protein